MKHRFTYQETLKSKRRRLSLNQQHVADYLGVGLTTYQRIESGKRPPYKNEAEILSETLSIDFDAFWSACENAWDQR